MATRQNGNSNQENSDFENQELDNRVSVVTPENIEFHYRAAGPFIRAIAYLIDLILLGVIVIFISIAFNWAIAILTTWLVGRGMTGLAESINAIASLFVMLSIFLIVWFYGVICEARFHGRTLGKRLTRLRVITQRGHRITLWQATIRNLVRFGELLPFTYASSLIHPSYYPDPIVGPGGPLFSFQQLVEALLVVPSGLVALVAITMTAKNQRLGDLFAGTIVIIEESTHRQKFARFSDPRVKLLAEYIPVGYVVTPELAKALADYGMRRNAMSIDRAREIAYHLAKFLMIEFRLPADTCPDLLLCALYYRTFIHSEKENEEAFGLGMQQPVLIN